MKKDVGKYPPNSVTFRGIEFPTYQKYYEDRIKLEAKIQSLQIVDIIQSVVILGLALVLLLK